MKYSFIVFSALAALAAYTGEQARADNMASMTITPATGAVALTPRWAIGGSLAGFHFMAQDLSLGGGASQFYSIKGTAIPSGGDIAAFTRYIAGSGAATDHADIGSKLTPNSYSALTSADPDIGYGAVNFYFIHHKTGGDYFTAIVPSSGTASAVTDLKPMSGPGGPATLGASGYFGLTFAAANLSYGLNMFYYLRTDSVTGSTVFGTLAPALLGTSTDKFDLGTSGYNALEFTGTDVGYGTDKMYYLRLDPITGFTILGTLHPVTGKVSDIANLGSVFSTLSFVPGDVGFGSSAFYTTGAINPTWQSVSFAAIADRAISSGSFTVSPSASSALPLTLSVVSGSTGAASISGPVSGVFTVTPTAPGVITLQATQVGQLAPTAYEYNMLRQSFTASGVATLAITTQPSAQSAAVGATANFSVVASGTSSLTYQWRKAGANITGNASATTATLTLANVQAGDAAGYDVVVTNTSGSISSNLVALSVTSGAPVITNSTLTAGGTAGTSFSYTITASGSPTSFTASPLPAGLSVNASTGVISGTPTSAGSTTVLLGAANGSGTDYATLTLTVASAGTAPVVVINPSSPPAATLGSPFNYTITASGSPTSYTATPLPAGLSIVAATGVISGTPTAVGTTSVLLGATNATGTGTATLSTTVAAPSIPPVITSPTTATGTAGSPFVTFVIAATGLPTVYSATGLPAGLTLNPSTGAINGTPTVSGTSVVTITATNSNGTTSATLTITVAAAPVAPVISSATTAPATAGAPFTAYVIGASGSPASYSATGLPPGLTLDTTTGTITGTPTTAGTYSVTLTATNAIGSGTTVLTITVGAAPSSRIVNFSARALSGPGSQTLIMGFIVSGNGMNLLVRGIGPALTAYGITGALADPMLTLYDTVGVSAVNDDWQTPMLQPAGAPAAASGTLIASSALSAGAFALPSGSKDAALLFTVNNGAHTTGMVRPNSTTGIALTEIYVTSAPSGTRLINVSARMNVTLGEGTLIAGLVISGNTPKRVLVRGVGPGLSSFGVTGVLADPKITLFSSNAAIATNDNWETGTSTAAQITTACAQVGAFALTSGSKDAAMLITLQPGLYTVVVGGVGNTTGVALVEIYDTE